jgi:hypothetical protein
LWRLSQRELARFLAGLEAAKPTLIFLPLNQLIGVRIGKASEFVFFGKY